MKKLLFLASIATLFLASCNEITEEKRFTYIKPAQVNRTVLIEDFTGQQCPNCPTATDIIHELQEEYGDTSIIAVGIHSGPTGFKGHGNYIGLATDLGDLYYYHYGVSYQPCGMINRHGLVNYDTWRSLVRSALEEKATLDLDLTCNYDEADNNRVDIDIDAYGTDGTTTGRLQLWVLEDSITAVQIMPTGATELNYVHNHVLRDAPNGEWGNEFTIAEGEKKRVHHEYRLNTAWKARNISIVAFVYNDNGVQQAVKKALIQ